MRSECDRSLLLPLSRLPCVFGSRSLLSRLGALSLSLGALASGVLSHQDLQRAWAPRQWLLFFRSALLALSAYPCLHPSVSLRDSCVRVCMGVRVRAGPSQALGK